MDLIVTSYWKLGGKTLSVSKHPNTNYKSVDHLQNTLKKRFKNKNVYWVKCVPNGIITMTLSGLTAQEVILR